MKDIETKSLKDEFLDIIGHELRTYVSKDIKVYNITEIYNHIPAALKSHGITDLIGKYNAAYDDGYIWGRILIELRSNGEFIVKCKDTINEIGRSRDDLKTVTFEINGKYQNHVTICNRTIKFKEWDKTNQRNKITFFSFIDLDQTEYKADKWCEMAYYKSNGVLYYENDISAIATFLDSDFNVINIDFDTLETEAGLIYSHNKNLNMVSIVINNKINVDYLGNILYDEDRVFFDLKLDW